MLLNAFYTFHTLAVFQDCVSHTRPLVLGSFSTHNDPRIPITSAVAAYLHDYNPIVPPTSRLSQKVRFGTRQRRLAQVWGAKSLYFHLGSWADLPLWCSAPAPAPWALQDEP